MVNAPGNSKTRVTHHTCPKLNQGGGISTHIFSCHSMWPVLVEGHKLGEPEQTRGRDLAVKHRLAYFCQLGNESLNSEVGGSMKHNATASRVAA